MLVLRFFEEYILIVSDDEMTSGRAVIQPFNISRLLFNFKCAWKIGPQIGTLWGVRESWESNA